MRLVDGFYLGFRVDGYLGDQLFWPFPSEQVPACYRNRDDACGGNERGDIGDTWPVIDVPGPCRPAQQPHRHRGYRAKGNECSQRPPGLSGDQACWRQGRRQDCQNEKGPMRWSPRATRLSVVRFHGHRLQ